MRSRHFEVFAEKQLLLRTRSHVSNFGGFFVSVEALAYVKSLDLGECEKARLLLYVIGENTFNDTFICVVGNEQLAYDTRVNERTVRRQIEALVAARIVLRKPRYPKAGGRLSDALRLVGFKRWYLSNYGQSKRAHRSKSKSEKSGNDNKPLPDKMSGSPSPLPDSTCPVGLPDTAMSGVTGHQVSGTYKDTRNYPVKSKSAPECAPSEDSNFDLEGKRVRALLRERFGDDKFKSWFAGLSIIKNGSSATVTTPNKFVRDWNRTHHEPAILAACQAVWPDVSRIEFVWRTEPKGAAA